MFSNMSFITLPHSPALSSVFADTSTPTYAFRQRNAHNLIPSHKAQRIPTTLINSSILHHTHTKRTSHSTWTIILACAPESALELLPCPDNTLNILAVQLWATHTGVLHTHRRACMLITAGRPSNWIHKSAVNRTWHKSANTSAPTSQATYDGVISRIHQLL